MKPIHKKIFFSGTNEFFDLFHNLFDRLKPIGYDPVWFKRPSFPNEGREYAPSECLNVVSKCEMYLLVLGKTYGSLYGSSTKSIVEAEFEVAFKLRMPVFIFVRSGIWEHYSIYAKVLSERGEISEPVFRSLHINGDLGVYRFIHRLQTLERDSRRATPWIREFISIDDIYDVLSTNATLISQNESINNPIGAQEEEQLLAETQPVFDLLNGTDFLTSIRDYSDNLPQAIKATQIATIARLSWLLVRFNPYFASAVLETMPGIDRRIRAILSPVVSLALGKDIKTDDLNQFYRSVEDETTVDCKLLITRVLRSVIYGNKALTLTKEWAEIINSIHLKQDIFHEVFFIDLELRHRCHYITLDPHLQRIAAIVFNNHQVAVPRSPLIQMEPLLSDPIGFTRVNNIESAVSKLHSIASRCSNEISARWCVVGILRILPLYDIDREHEYYPTVVDVLTRFRDVEKGNSPTLLYFLLSMLLRAAARTGDRRYLERFEILFSRNRNVLNVPHTYTLQLEYASTLVLAIEREGTWADSSLDRIEIAIREKRFESFPLLKNKLVTSDLRFRECVVEVRSGRKGVLTLLVHFLRSLYDQFAGNLIEHGHMRLAQFRVTSLVYSVRRRLNASVLLSLHRELSKGSHPADYFARSMFVFLSIDKNVNRKLIVAYAMRASRASGYDLIKNAASIFSGLLVGYYYTDSETRMEIARLLPKLAETTGIGNGPPRSHWLYYAGIQIGMEAVEVEFIRSLFREDRRRQELRRFDWLEVGSIEANAILFLQIHRKIIEEFVLRGAIMPQIVRDRLNDPEVWNVIATSLYNVRDTIPDGLEMSAYFYGFATAFAKGSNLNLQKYWYNYIRCVSLFLVREKRLPSEGFIRETLIYISRPLARSFAYKHDCIVPFFILVKNSCPRLSPGIRIEILDKMRSIEWLRDERTNRDGLMDALTDKLMGIDT